MTNNAYSAFNVSDPQFYPRSWVRIVSPGVGKGRWVRPRRRRRRHIRRTRTGLRGEIRPRQTAYDCQGKSRRDKAFGTWVAAQLGLTGQDANDYTKNALKAVQHPGDAALIAKVLEDLKAKGMEERALKKKLIELIAMPWPRLRQIAKRSSPESTLEPAQFCQELKEGRALILVSSSLGAIRLTCASAADNSAVPPSPAVSCARKRSHSRNTFNPQLVHTL